MLRKFPSTFVKSFYHKQVGFIWLLHKDGSHFATQREGGQKLELKGECWRPWIKSAWGPPPTQHLVVGPNPAGVSITPHRYTTSSKQSSLIHQPTALCPL